MFSDILFSHNYTYKKNHALIKAEYNSKEHPDFKLFNLKKKLS